jgi:protein-S-isoprenylcysteine O-methyltransferase Ste14
MHERLDMLHRLMGVPSAWHGHYYCALAVLPAFLLQVCFFKYAHSDRTAGASIVAVALFGYAAKLHTSLAVRLNVGFLLAWGVRIGIRGVPVEQSGFTFPSSYNAALSKTIWTWTLCAPTTYAVAFDASELPEGFPLVGATLCALGFLIDVVERNKLRGTFTRNPYIFTSLAVCWGLFIIHPSPWTAGFPVLFSCILMNVPGGFEWNESRLIDKFENTSDETQEYVRVTSPLFPMPHMAYASIHVWWKKNIFLDRHAENFEVFLHE